MAWLGDRAVNNLKLTEEMVWTHTLLCRRRRTKELCSNNCVDSKDRSTTGRELRMHIMLIGVELVIGLELCW